MPEKQTKTIDEYISEFPIQVQEILKHLRRVIRESAPDAEERISYRMPTFRMKRNLVHFAAHKNHIGFYPTPSAIIAFKDELAGYETSKGAIRFPLETPMPYDLIRKIIEFRVNEVSEKK